MSAVTGVDVEHTKAQLSDWRRQMEHLRFMRIQIATSLPWKLLAKAEALVAAVERAQSQVDAALRILEEYDISEEEDFHQCATEDRWRLYRDLTAVLKPEALEPAKESHGNV